MPCPDLRRATQPRPLPRITFNDIFYLRQGGIALIKTLTKHGNSLALILDKPVLDLLDIEPDTPLSITTDGHSLTIAPVRDSGRVEKLAKIRSDVNGKYESAFRKLAE
jgi:antitoxin component of MazEF toxin-antitoxin module